MQVDESSKNSNEHIVVDTVVHLDRYKAMNMRVNFIFYTCFTWWVSALRGWCASFGGHSPIRTALWIQQHVNRTHMEFICSNEKHNRGNNNNNWGYYSYVLIFSLPFCHILCYVNRPPSDILIPRITRKDNEQNETKWDQHTHTHTARMRMMVSINTFLMLRKALCMLNIFIIWIFLDGRTYMHIRSTALFTSRLYLSLSLSRFFGVL